MTEHVFKNQAGLAKTGVRMRAKIAPISFHTTLRNPKKFRPKKRNEMEEYTDIDTEFEMDFPSKPNLNQVTKPIDTSLNRFRLAVKQFLENMRKGDHDVRLELFSQDVFHYVLFRVHTNNPKEAEIVSGC